MSTFFLLLAMGCLFGCQLIADTVPALTATSATGTFPGVFSITGSSFEIAGSLPSYAPPPFVFFDPTADLRFQDLVIFQIPLNQFGTVTIGGVTHSVQYAGLAFVYATGAVNIPMTLNPTFTVPGVLSDTGQYSACMPPILSAAIACPSPSGLIASISIDVPIQVTYSFNGPFDLGSGSIGYQFTTVQFTGTTIPEPSSVLLSLIGATAIARIVPFQAVGKRAQS
jgi:hypothetical protein